MRVCASPIRYNRSIKAGRGHPYQRQVRIDPNDGLAPRSFAIRYSPVLLKRQAITRLTQGLRSRTELQVSYVERAMHGRYTSVAIALHWALAALILLNLPLGVFGDAIEELSGASMVWLHKSIGITVLSLTLMRICWRLSHRPPRLPEDTAAWQRFISSAVHLLLYVLMLAVPLSGWLRTSAGSYPLRWFELLDVPKFPLAHGSPEARFASDAHEVLAWSLALLAALHIAAALYHRLVLRDEVMRRMVPLRGTV